MENQIVFVYSHPKVIADKIATTQDGRKLESSSFFSKVILDLIENNTEGNEFDGPTGDIQDTRYVDIENLKGDISYLISELKKAKDAI